MSARTHNPIGKNMMEIPVIISQGLVLHVFCSNDCIDSYLWGTDTDNDIGTLTHLPAFECISCHWCGVILYTPDRGCFYHGNICPGQHWTYTVQAIEAISTLTQLQNRPVSDEQVRDLEQLSTQFGHHFPGAALARAVHAASKFLGDE
jgi:hypothetical protein